MKKQQKIPQFILLLLLAGLNFLFNFLSYAQEIISSDCVTKAWQFNKEGKYEEIYQVFDECTVKFSSEAHALSSELKDFPVKESLDNYKVMNDIATLYFIKGRTLKDNGKLDEAKKVLEEVIAKYPYAQAFDEDIGYWPIKKEAEKIIADIYERKGWALQGSGQFDEVYKITDECIARFSWEADKSASELTDFPPREKDGKYKIMIEVAVCYFIKGETLRNEVKNEEAKKVLKELVKKYPYAEAFNEAGWWWSVREKAEDILKQIDGDGCPQTVNEIQEEVKITLYDEGTEFPVNYPKYGEFVNAGKKDYKYVVKDPVELGRAAGEGIQPNSNSIKFDPAFVEIKKELPAIKHWEILNSRDFRKAFYKWNLAPEPQGVKQFYLADILERSGLIKHALKAYYAVLVHFPDTYAWTYWNTPWYPGKAALYRIKYLLRENPQWDVVLEGASIQIINGYDNDIRNDIFVVNPGKLRKMSMWEKVKNKGRECFYRGKKLGKIVETRGGDKVKLIKYKRGDWQMLVDGKPFMVKGITYSPTRVGETPHKGTLKNWTTQDLNKNGLIDSPYETWVDKNKDNLQDSNEPVTGDFYLLKQMGVNCIRLYYQPFELNKELLRQMHEKYGIYIIIGDFLGKYTIGSGAKWEEGTDYDNPVHKENMLDSVRKMVTEFKDEPYVLIWLLGNENVYGLGCNADKKPASFFKFANEAALLIKSLDPEKRPVAIASGDTLYLDIFAQNCPDIDIFGSNCYRGKYGFLDLWDEVKRTAGKPVMPTEYGAPAYAEGYLLEEAEAYQSEYHRGAWLDISCNSCSYGAGIAVGGIAFEWLDEWWKAYEPFCHDAKRLSAGPFLGGYYREEWFGLCSQGDGKQSPYLRQLRKAYYTYQELWSGGN